MFDSSAFDPEAGTIELRYSLDDELCFTETLRFPGPPPPPGEGPGVGAKTLQALHLIAGISYYKTCCPKNIEVRSGSLTKHQAEFWNTVYEKGLGEFFFRNNIDFHGLMNFPTPQQSTINNQRSTTSPEVRSPKSVPTPYALRPTPKLLVPLGGGKDSTVTAELLKKAGFDVTLFRVGHHPLIEETATVAGLPLLTVERHLAPELFDLNAQGALNGHVPVTAYLSFLSILIAELYGFDAVVMSNERSASEGNLEYLGTKINHQWSKSMECERMVQKHLQDIGSPVQYFSLLRPLSELAIAKMFAGMPQYFPCTTSCNANWKIASSQFQSSRVPEFPTPSNQGNREIGKSGERNRWCGRCPKCAFAFCLFAAFLPKKTLQEIFGKNLFDEEVLQPFFRQLFGVEGFKPFECVGTPEETTAAFLLAHERGDLEDTKAMRFFEKEVKPRIKDGKKLIEESLTPSSDHCIPDPFQRLIA